MITEEKSVLTSRKILLAEDDEDDRLIFSAIIAEIKGSDFSFDSVENGIEVLRCLAGIEEGLPSLIVLDQNMPRMNGRETLVALKADARYAHIPVVIYSTYNDSRLIGECLAAGAEELITKPDSFEGFRDMIVKLTTHYLTPANGEITV